jgi:Ca2+-binding RTX toxin-like protein
LSFVAEPNSGDLTLSLVTNDANVAAGATLRILSGSSVGSSVAYTFDGSAETDGHFEMDDNTGNDHLTGGALSDLFYITGGGDDTVNGGGGDDVIQAGAAFTAADKISGGQGNDTLELSGDYSGGVTLALNTLHSVETIKLDDNNTYKLTPDDANVAAGATLTIDATALEGSNALILNGSHELDGHFVVKGGDGNDIVIGGGQSDTLFGGNGNDEFEGQGGADLISGGAGADIFEATETSDSTGAAHDTIVGFDTSADRFLLGGEQVKQIEAAVIKGGLNAARFDTGLEAAIGKAQLSVHGAVVFTPSVGDLKGHVFLIVDENGHAGYQAGQDYVFELKNAVDLNHLATTNFS